jgi:hypothetical protein
MENTWFQGLVFTGGVVVYLLFGLILWWVLDQYIRPQDSGEKKDLIQALGLIMAGLAGIVGVYFTWRNLSNAQDQLTGTQAQLQLAREGQIIDRFTKAIDQIGATDEGKKRLEIRIGGIYALARIAQDSVQYYDQIMEILTAYIRENARLNARLPPTEASLLPSAERDEREAHEWDLWVELWRSGNAQRPAPPTDIQAILDVLRSRDEARVPSSYRISFNLTRTDLRGANIVGIDLAEADLNGANLQDAWLPSANLEGVDLIGANLQRAWLSRVRLTGADLGDAQLEGAVFGETELYKPPVQLARLVGLEETKLDTINFQAADLSETKRLRQEQLELAVGDASVNLPEHLQQPKMWDLEYLQQFETIRERMKEQVSEGLS